MNTESNTPLFESLPQEAIDERDQDPVQELEDLLHDRKFIDRYIEVSTSAERNVLEDLRLLPSRKAYERLDEMILEAAARSLSEPDVASAKKRGKEFGLARKSVTSMEYNGETYPLNERSDNPDLIDMLSTEHPVPQDELTAAQDRYAHAQSEAAERIARLHTELKTHMSEPSLKQALGVWGKSPDSEGSLGKNGTGHNAGAIHYFEYRGHPEKSARFKTMDMNVSIPAFIERSDALNEMIQDPENHPAVERYALIGDEYGQKRLYILSQGEFIVAFQRKDEPMKVVSVLPGSNVNDFEKKVEIELLGKIAGRLNILGSERTLLKSK